MTIIVPCSPRVFFHSVGGNVALKERKEASTFPFLEYQKNGLATQHCHWTLRHGAALETSRSWRDRSLYWWGLLELKRCASRFFLFGRSFFFASLKKIDVSFNRFSNLRAFATQGPLVFWGVLQMICELRCLMSPSKTETTRRKKRMKKKTRNLKQPVKI